MTPGSWIGVDLDGCLASYQGRTTPHGIGRPVPAMMERVRRWLAAGRTVKIFTARITGPNAAAEQQLVVEWLRDNDLPDLAITNAKDRDMVELWDDRAVQVVCDTGERVDL